MLEEVRTDFQRARATNGLRGDHPASAWVKGLKILAWASWAMPSELPTHSCLARRHDTPAHHKRMGRNQWPHAAIGKAPHLGLGIGRLCRVLSGADTGPAAGTTGHSRCRLAATSAVVGHYGRVNEALLRFAMIRGPKTARLAEQGRVFARDLFATDPKIIRALYKASQSGVRIDLVVRGMCCCLPVMVSLNPTRE